MLLRDIIVILRTNHDVSYLDSFCSECDTHPYLYLSIEFIVCTMYLVWGLLSVLCILFGVYCLYYVFSVCSVSVFVLYRVCSILTTDYLT
jgi:hypothetical protein